MAADTQQIIGIDFDNTIIDYELQFYQLALHLDLIPSNCKGKVNIRNHIRRQKDGETSWQKIQAKIYGQEIKKAPVMPGCSSFLSWCKEKKITIAVISHKTIFAAQDKNKINLRVVATQWLTKHFPPPKQLVDEKNIYFENSRQDKVERIRGLNCSHFIDDLEETFTTTCFPKQTIPILLNAQPANEFNGLKAKTWAEILQYFHGT